MKTFSVKNLEIGSGLPKIAVPVQGKTPAELISRALLAEPAADLLEIRLDGFE